MSTDTANPNSYPAPIQALLPRARELAETLGAVPSRNKLMQELKIGAPKAGALRDILTDTPPALPAGTGRLHLVTDPEPHADAPAPDPEPPATDLDSTGITTVTSAPTETAPVATAPETPPLASTDGHPGTPPPVRLLIEDELAPYYPAAAEGKPVRRRPWPVLIFALPAFVAIWSGWVGLGGLTGFGVVYPLPGIVDGFALNSAITLPVGVEAYAAYALSAWLSGRAPARARRFAKWSALGSLALGMLGQIAYHLMTAMGISEAPWPITTLVSCLPVAVLGMGAALAHLLRSDG